MVPDELPRDLPSFLARFGTDAQCRAYLFAQRWPQGFCCQGCGHGAAYHHRRRLIDECVGLRQAAFAAGRHDLRADQDRAGALVSGDLAGDLEQGRHLGHGAAAADGLRQLPDRLVLAAQDPQGDGPARTRQPLAARVEADETLVGGAKPGRPGRGAAGKTVVAGAVEAAPGKGRKRRLGRLRLQAVPDASAMSLEAFLAANVAPPAAVATDGWQGYAGLDQAGYDHEPINLADRLGRRGAAPARDPPRLRPRQALAARHAPRRRPHEAPPGLSRRVRLPLQPPHRQEHRPPLRPADRAGRPHPARQLPRHRRPYLRVVER